MMKKKVIVDLKLYREKLEDAGYKNGQAANTIYVQFFAIIMTTALAELAFLGTFELGQENPSLLSVVAATMIIFSMILLAISMYMQKSQFSLASKYFYQLSTRVNVFMKDEREHIFPEIPEELVAEDSLLAPNKITGLYMSLAFAGIVLSSLLILVSIWSKIL
jgi:hypothetical protein